MRLRLHFPVPEAKRLRPTPAALAEASSVIEVSATDNRASVLAAARRNCPDFYAVRDVWKTDGEWHTSLVRTGKQTC